MMRVSPEEGKLIGEGKFDVSSTSWNRAMEQLLPSHLDGLLSMFVEKFKDSYLIRKLQNIWCIGSENPF